MSNIIFPENPLDDIRKTGIDLTFPYFSPVTPGLKAKHPEGRIIANGNSFDNVKGDEYRLWKL